MGQLLSHPVEEKELDYKSHTKMTYCVGSMQGYRMSMEDAHSVKINEDETVAVFGVFDGHGGKQCSEYLREHLAKHIFKHLLSEKDKASRHHSRRQCDNKHIIALLKHAFFKTDHDLSHYSNFINCGSTGIILCVVNNKLYVANTGDSRCILSTQNGCAKPLSFDQKPNLMGERVRIENSNGYVVNNRINEILALSRAFGDFKFKIPFLKSTNNEYIIQNIKMEKTNPHHFLESGSSLEQTRAETHEYVQIPPELFQVTVEPDILIYDMNEVGEPEFVVMACDGIWDCFKNSQLVKLIRDKLVLGWRLNKIVEYILNDSLTMANNYTGIGFDNMTLIILALHSDGDIDKWYEKMITKIEREKGLRTW
ncbi:uncharacterized protein LODBEIA_P17010 [Lodderomyces beijingensis]|uniref:protein-serine/threonine phosphatase n=1 Tax=Lodderomyces beijingensis TaxID=1775926 RepID=A0ABP0ZJ61_9ASCO